LPLDPLEFDPRFPRNIRGSAATASNLPAQPLPQAFGDQPSPTGAVSQNPQRLVDVVNSPDFAEMLEALKALGVDPGVIAQVRGGQA
jgi:hypothetical protein